MALSFQPRPFSLYQFLGCVATVAVGVSLAVWLERHTMLEAFLQNSMLDHLGSEYDNIAQSIVSTGRYASPFDSVLQLSDGAHTLANREFDNRTAWMPPILPCILATLYLITGNNRDWVVFVFVSLQALSIAYMLFCFTIAVFQRKAVVDTWVICLCALAANFYLLFQFTHDTGLLIVLNCLLWQGCIARWGGPINWEKTIRWGLFGGVAALSSPVMGLVWAVVTTWRWSKQKTNLAHLFAVATISALIVTPWTIRNYLVLNRLVPIKSNGMFELWQAQCADDDGIFDLKTAQTHPYSRHSKLWKEYNEMGEIAFVNAKADLVKQAIAENPLYYLERVGNRLIAAFVYYTPFNERDEHKRPWPLFLKRLVFPLPLISLYVIIVFAPRPLPPQVSAAISIWILSLIPYVLVSYYERYATPLLITKLIIISYAWSIVKEAFMVRRTRAGILPKS